IVWPGTRFTILESREKKAGFLERVVRELGIKNVTVACGRLEEYGRSWTAEPHSSVYIRALGDLPGVLRYSEPVAVPGSERIYFLGGDTAVDRLVAPLGPAREWTTVLDGAFGGRLLRGYFPPGLKGSRSTQLFAATYANVSRETFWFGICATPWRRLPRAPTRMKAAAPETSAGGTERGEGGWPGRSRSRIKRVGWVRRQRR